MDFWKYLWLIKFMMLHCVWISAQIAHLRLSSSKSEGHELITWPLHLDLFQLLARIECGIFARCAGHRQEFFSIELIMRRYWLQYIDMLRVIALVDEH